MENERAPKPIAQTTNNENMFCIHAENTLRRLEFGNKRTNVDFGTNGKIKYKIGCDNDSNLKYRGRLFTFFKKIIDNGMKENTMLILQNKGT